MRLISPFITLCAVALEIATAAPVKSPAVFPLAFERHGVNYLARGSDYALSVTPGGAILSWNQPGTAVLRVEMPGANANAALEGGERMPGRVTYLLGSSRGGSYELYGQVRARSIYPGIDVVYHGNQGRLEYDFYLAPGASPDSITLQFPGSDSMQIDSAGNLIVGVGRHQIRQPKPVAWQLINGRRRYRTTAFQKDSGGRIRFRMEAYDSTRSLVIDPILIFDNPFGGTASSSASGLALDSQGNAYVTGNTTSLNFVTVNPFQGQQGTAPLLSSANAAQTWTFETVGTAVSISSIVAAPGNSSILYANSEQGIFQSSDAGSTWKQAANKGLSPPAVDISVDGGSASTLYACNDLGIFVSVDAGNNWTQSNTGINIYSGRPGAPCYAIRANPFKPGTVYVMNFNPSGFYRSVDSGKTWQILNTGDTAESVNSLVFNAASPDTLIAGEIYNSVIQSADGGDTWSPLGIQSVGNNHGLAIDPSNPSNLYLVNGAGAQRSIDGGRTWTVVLPAPDQSGYYNSAVAVDPRNPNLVYVFEQRGLFVSTDSGQTWSMAPLPYHVMPGSLFVGTDSRILLGTQAAGDIFVTKWDPTGTQVLYSTYLGGSGSDSAAGIAVDSAGNAYVAGYTSSTNFPVTANALQKSLTGNHNAFIAKLSADGSRLVYSTLFGGGTEFTSAIAVNTSGAAYITGQVTSDLPLSASAFQKLPGGGACKVQVGYVNYATNGDGFVAKISPDGSSLLYSSYLGGSCYDRGYGIAANADGSAWVVGATFSPDFPVTSDALQPKFGGGFGDGFLVKVAPGGDRLTYSTYLGSSGYDEVDALTRDSAGNLYLTGSSHGFTQPASAGAYQSTSKGGCLILGIGPPLFNVDGNAFVMKLNPSATAVTGLTYLGSPCDAGGTAIALDPTGAPWIAGFPSANFPTATPFAIQVGRGFVSKFSPDLTQLLFSTYFDAVNGLAVDAAGMAYVAGSTTQTTGSLGAFLGNVPTQAYIAKLDSSPSPVSLNNVLTASPFLTTAQGNAEQVAPGKVIRLSGAGLGPAAKTAGIVNAGVIATSVAGVQVTFDGLPVPLLYVSATEISCITPFGIAGHTSTTIQVIYNGAKSNSVVVPVYTASTEVLAVLNQDFTVNSPSNPAAPGSTIELYLTGAGQTSPASADGQVYANPLPRPTGSVTVNNLGTLQPVTFAAAAYGMAAGILQVNFQAPDKTPDGVLVVSVNGSIAYFNISVR